MFVGSLIFDILKLFVKKKLYIFVSLLLSIVLGEGWQFVCTILASWYYAAVGRLGKYSTNKGRVNETTILN